MAHREFENAGYVYGLYAIFSRSQRHNHVERFAFLLHGQPADTEAVFHLGNRFCQLLPAMN